MKIVIGVLSIIVGYFLGKKLSEKYIKRKTFYDDFYNFNQNLKTEVSFSQNSLKQIIEKDSDSLLLLYLKEIIIDKNKDIKINFLSDEENSFVYSYSKNLGKSDKESQLQFLASCDSKIKIYQSKADEDANKYKKLYPKLGFLIGLIILVVLI